MDPVVSLFEVLTVWSRSLDTIVRNVSGHWSQICVALYRAGAITVRVTPNAEHDHLCTRCVISSLLTTQAASRDVDTAEQQVPGRIHRGHVNGEK